jgi:hypothetical protein
MGQERNGLPVTSKERNRLAAKGEERNRLPAKGKERNRLPAMDKERVLEATEQTLQRTRDVAPQRPSPLNLGFGD